MRREKPNKPRATCIAVLSHGPNPPGLATKLALNPGAYWGTLPG